eukprot:769078_1
MHSQKSIFPLLDIQKKSFKKKESIELIIALILSTASFKEVMERPWTCQFSGCEKSFKKQAKLQRHILVHSGVKPFRCDECGKTYSRNNHLKRHILSHSDERKFECPKDGCSCSFRTKSHLNRHMKYHEKWECLTCGYCSKTFRKRHQLLSHEHSHTNGPLPFPCTAPGCTLRFKLLQSRTRHFKREHRSKPAAPTFICALPGCEDVKLDCYEALRTHNDSSHPDLKVYVCPVCGKHFQFDAWLKKHVAVHSAPVSDRKTFTCEFDGCGRSYTKKSNLNAHVRSVHSSSQFVCGIDGCAESYSLKQALRRHQERVHINPPEVDENPLPKKRKAPEDRIIYKLCGRFDFEERPPAQSTGSCGSESDSSCRSSVTKKAISLSTVCLF